VLFKVIYQNEDVPPPYKHTYTIEVSALPAGLGIKYNLEYLERDTLDDEEIFDEGFTLDDNYKWEGLLNVVWKEFINDFLNKTTFKPSSGGSHLVIHLSRDTDPKTPSNLKEWEYMLQELTQAIFEESGREAPLELTFAEIIKTKKVLISFVVSFAERRLTLFENINKVEKEKIIDWNESKELMNTVYSLEYLGEKALVKPPKKEGKFIDIGEGAWYQLGVAALNPKKNKDLLEKLETLFKSKI